MCIIRPVVLVVTPCRSLKIVCRPSQPACTHAHMNTDGTHYSVVPKAELCGVRCVVSFVNSMSLNINVWVTATLPA